MEIKNSVIVITGASRGIGLATAQLLTEKGARVVLAARSTKILAEIEKKLPGSFAITTDMRSPADIKNLIEKAVGKFGRIDILINNAGQGMYGPVETVDLEKYREIMDLNVYGVLAAMQAVIPVMRKQGGGMVVNISSRVSKNYYPNLGAYASTKYALNALSLTARAELAHDHIAVSVMHPKMTATDFGQNSAGAHPDITALYQNRNNAIPIDTPEEVAEKIADLIVSEEPEASM